MANNKKLLKSFACTLAMLFYPIAATATGYQFFEQSGSCVGNACAGAAAAAQDASAMQFNPAGLSYVHGNQVVGVLHTLVPSTQFSNEGSTTILGTPAVGTNGGDAGSVIIVPNLYYSTDRVGHGLTVGVGLNSPFGLRTSYDGSWVGRYQAIGSDLKTIDLVGNVAYRYSNAISIGAGVNFIHATASLSYAIDSWAACVAGGAGPGVCSFLFTGPGNAATDGRTELDFDAWGVGYNVGVILAPTDNLRAGISFHSKVDLGLSGSATFTVPPPLAAAFTNTSVTSKLVLPEVVSFSVFDQVNAQWALMGDVTWTNWNRFNQLKADFDNALPAAVIPEKWHDTFRYSLGVTYTCNQLWKIRAGTAYDETPVRQAFRTPSIPDASRTYLTVGLSRSISPHGTIDVGYVHEFAHDAVLNKIGELDGSRLVGRYKSEADVLSLQYTHSF